MSHTLTAAQDAYMQDACDRAHEAETAEGAALVILNAVADQQLIETVEAFADEHKDSYSWIWDSNSLNCVVALVGNGGNEAVVIVYVDDVDFEHTEALELWEAGR